jgi:hypothetical protein
VFWFSTHKFSLQCRRRIFSLIIIVIVTGLGVTTKFYTGPAAVWVNNSSGGVLYVIFWCQIIHFIWPLSSPFLVSPAVLIATCAIEFTQLSHLETLESIRKTFIGRTLIGNSFNPDDFIYYVAGSAAALFCQYINRRQINLFKKGK